MGIDLQLKKLGRLTTILPSTKVVVEGLQMEVVGGGINPNVSESCGEH